MDYEVTLKELENIIEEMESSDIKLEDMMEKYKKAIDLYKDLEKYYLEFITNLMNISKEYQSYLKERSE